MRKKLHFIAFIGLLAISVAGYSQRYLTETFSSVTVTPNVVYGNNISILTGSPVASNLLMDVYQPTGDVLTARPLVIVLHTGNFLPAIANGAPTGSRKDSAVVEMCTKFAKRGYVAVAASYRQGWNPISTSQDVRTGTLLNAVYRAIQDAKNCVRFFKNDASLATPVYKIDSTKIAVGGLGSGGYVAIACATLNKTSEILMTKFTDFSQTPPVPYVNQTLSGNFDGTNTTPLNTPNYAAHTSSINVVFNVGGAIGDTTWLEAGEVPMISLHTYKDPFAPYKTGAVVVPTTGDFVVTASGSYDVQRKAEQLGNNAIFTNSYFNDPYSVHANTVNNGYKNLFPFITPAPGAALVCGAQVEQGSPWDFWDQATFIAQYNAYTSTTNGAGANCKQLLSNPDMTPAKGKTYIDTIQGFVNPRLVCALGLAGCVPNSVAENENNAAVSIYPNPTNADFTISLAGVHTIQQVKLYDVTGRLVKTVSGLNTQTFTMNTSELHSGVYFSRVQLNNKTEITKKVILK